MLKDIHFIREKLSSALKVDVLLEDIVQDNVLVGSFKGTPSKQFIF
jgi:hypothetical protein